MFFAGSRCEKSLQDLGPTKGQIVTILLLSQNPLKSVSFFTLQTYSFLLAVNVKNHYKI